MTLGQSTPLYVAGGIKLATIKWNPAIYRADVMDANARLIAAAPAMYEALKEMVDMFNPYAHCIKSDKGMDAIQKAIAAIAAAEGRK